MSLRDRVAQIAQETALSVIKTYLTANTATNPLNNAPMVPVVSVAGSNNVVVQMPDGTLQTVSGLGTRILGPGDLVLVNNGVAL